MKTIISSYLLIFCLNVVSAQSITGAIQSGGVSRTYRLNIPPGYTPGSSLPLIIHTHGYTSNAFNEQNVTRYSQVADTANFMVVYPEGMKDGNNNRYWNVGLPSFPNAKNDVQFVSDLIDTLHLRYNIDLNRVYSSGFSMGSFMSYILASQLGSRIAAIGSVSGGMYAPVIAAAVPGRPVPVLHIHGTADDAVTYNGIGGGGGLFGHVHTDSLIRFWVNNGMCNPVPAIDTLPDLVTTDGSRPVRYLYSGGASNSEVVFYKILNGLHAWPGTTGAGINQDMKASVEIWKFLKPYRLDQFVGFRKTVNPAVSFSIIPNPASGKIKLILPDGLKNSDFTLVIFNSLGEKVRTETYSATSDGTLDIHTLLPGMYRVQIQTKNGVYWGKVVKGY